MKPGEFEDCVRRGRLSVRQVADFLRVDEGTVRQWKRESRPVPETVAKWLRGFSRDLAKAYERNPPPAEPVVAFRGPGAAERRAQVEDSAK